MTDEEKQKIIKRLQEVGANFSCGRCGNNNFTLMDGYFFHNISYDKDKVMIGGDYIELIGVVCNRCGYTAYHSLKILLGEK